MPRWDESRVKTPEVIERMRYACDMAADILRMAGEIVQPGMTTDDIDIFVHDETIRRGAYPSPMNYHHYTKSVCTSLNEVICHGIPDSTVLRDGDIINLDITLEKHGFIADSSKTYLVGHVPPAARRLVRVTQEAMWQGIKQVRPGAHLGTSQRFIPAKLA